MSREVVIRDWAQLGRAKQPSGLIRPVRPRQNRSDPAHSSAEPTDPSSHPSKTSETVIQPVAVSTMESSSSRLLFDGVAAQASDSQQGDQVPKLPIKSRSKRKAPRSPSLSSPVTQKAALKLSKSHLKSRKPPDPSPAKSKLIREALKASPDPSFEIRDTNLVDVALIAPLPCSDGICTSESPPPTVLPVGASASSSISPELSQSDSDLMILDTELAGIPVVDAFDLNMPDS
ncbi:hypothetical protein LINPERHAP2_LOCUS19240 [Linum perenne]